MSEELRKNLVIGGVRYPIAVGQSGKGPPTAATPGKVGVTYLNESNNVLYVCTAADVEAGAYTWVMVTGLYYTTTVTQPTAGTIKFEQRPNISGIPIPNPVTVTLPTGGGGMSVAAAKVLDTILKNLVPYSDQTANIDALYALLTQDDTAQDGVSQTGSVLTIISGVTATQDGDTLTIT